MAVKKTGLGKGLDTLIPKEKASSTTLRIDEIEPNKDQPRRYFDEAALQELAESIKQFGVITPLIVQKMDGYYEIVAGERRWRAARLAGLKELPVVIRNYSDEERAEIALIENIQREDLNPIEEAEAYKRLLEEYKLKQEEVAVRVSKSRAAITNSLRLLKLDERVQKMVISGEITTGHARALLGLDDQEKQYQMAQRIVLQHLSVRAVESLVKGVTAKKPRKKKKTEKKSIFIKDMESKMESVMGTKVTLNHTEKGSGTVEIAYYSEEDLDRIYQILLSAKE